MSRPPAPARLLSALLAVLAVGCGEGAAVGPTSAGMRLTLTGLRALDPGREGTYEAWVLDAAGGAHSAGRFQLRGEQPVELVAPPAAPVGFQVTVEPPGDADPAPSAQVLLRGAFRRKRAELRLNDVVTAANLDLRERPGQYTVFTPSDNHVSPYPSNEYAGVWLFNSAPRETPQGDLYVRLSPLRDGWLYEGWMVRDLGLPGEVWLSYGKFRPSNDAAVDVRDDTGWGPFSGVDDYRTAGAENFPGDDWVANPFGLPFPPVLSLPIDLRERNAAGEYRWSHVITIEPAWNLGEPIGDERPFLLRPYLDRFFDNGIGRPRPVTLRPEALPSGRVEVR